MPADGESNRFCSNCGFRFWSNLPVFEGVCPSCKCPATVSIVETTTRTPAKTCATCRFMGAEDGLEFYDPDLDTDENDGSVTTKHHPCARIIHGNGLLSYGAGSSKAIKDEPAIVTDGSGYSARLRVLPTFGCNLHEYKSQIAEKTARASKS